MKCNYSKKCTNFMVNTAFIHCFLSRNYDVHPPQFLGNNP